MSDDLDDRGREIAAAIADAGYDPGDYTIILDDDTGEWSLEKRVTTLQRREDLAVAEESLVKALREFGYSADEIESLDVVEMARIFADEYTARQQEEDGDPR